MLAEMDISQLAIIAVILFGASLIQGAIGFAFAIFCAPLLLMVGIPIEQAIGIISVGSITQSSQGFWSLRSHIEPRTLVTPISLRMLGVFGGIFVLAYFSTLPLDDVKMGAGWMILALLGVQIASERAKHLSFNQPTSWGMFLLSGIMAGMIGIGGPPLVIWAMAQKSWSTQRIRAFLYAQFCFGIAFQIILLCWKFGEAMLNTVAMSMLFIPCIIVGNLVGLPLGNKLSKAKLKVITYVILFFISGKLILG